MSRKPCCPTCFTTLKKWYPTAVAAIKDCPKCSRNRVHKAIYPHDGAQSSGESAEARCGLSWTGSEPSRKSRNWKRVTCKRCLRHKPKRRRRPAEHIVWVSPTPREDTERIYSDGWYKD